MTMAYAQTSQVFLSKLILLQVLSHIQLISGLTIILAVLICLIKDAASYDLIDSADKYLPLLFGGLPAGTILIASYLHIKRLKEDKYRDTLPLYISEFRVLTILNFLFAIAMVVLGAVYIKKLELTTHLSVYNSHVISVVIGSLNLFVSLPYLGISLQAGQQSAL